MSAAQPSPWHEGLFDGIEAAAAAYSNGVRLPPEDNTLFWDWAERAFGRQAQDAAETRSEDLRAMCGDDLLAYSKANYQRAYAWAFAVQLRYINFGSGGLDDEDLAAYEQARGRRP